MAFIETSAYQSVNIDKAFNMMVEEMVKEYTRSNNGGQYEHETNLEGHNIIELTNKQEEYESNKKKKCC